jgi:hypothetical protein
MRTKMSRAIATTGAAVIALSVLTLQPAAADTRHEGYGAHAFRSEYREPHYMHRDRDQGRYNYHEMFRHPFFGWRFHHHG